MTQRRALGDHVDSAFDDPDNGWFGHVQAVDPTPPHDHPDTYLPPDLPPDDAPGTDAPLEDATDIDATSTEDTDRWPVLTVEPTPSAHVDDVRADWVPADFVPDEDSPAVDQRWGDVYESRPSGPPEADLSPGAFAPGHGTIGAPATRSWESRLSDSGAWDFKVSATSTQRNRSKLAVAGVVAAVLAVAGVVLLLRSPGPADDASTVVSTNESTGQPAPSSAAPVLPPAPSNTLPVLPPAPPPPPPAPPPPPPPPPMAEQISPPIATRDNTPRRQTTPTQSKKPEVNVTRTPSRPPRSETRRAPDDNPWDSWG